MQITITGRSFNLSDKIKAHIYEKFQKLQKFFHRIEYIDVILEESHQFHVEIKIGIPRQSPLIITENGDKMYSCIDKSLDRTVNSLSRLKEKQQDQRHRSIMREY